MHMPRLLRTYPHNPVDGHVTDETYRANGNFDLFDDSRDDERLMNTSIDASGYVMDIREYDVPYHVRVMIDLGRCATLSA